jgi:hypothetical protein
MLSLVVAVRSSIVDGLDVANQERVFHFLLTEDILLNTVEEGGLDPVKGTEGLYHGPSGLTRVALTAFTGRTVGSTSLKIAVNNTVLRAGAGDVRLVVLEGAVVVVHENMIRGHGWNLATLEEERTVENVPRLQLPILLDEDTVEVWKKEDGGKETDTGSNNKNAAKENTEFSNLDLGSTLPHDKHYKC